MYWSKSFKMKRLGAPKVASGGVGNPVHMVVLDVSEYVCITIVLGIYLSYFYLKGTMFPFVFFLLFVNLCQVNLGKELQQ